MLCVQVTETYKPSDHFINKVYRLIYISMSGQSLICILFKHVQLFPDKYFQDVCYCCCLQLKQHMDSLLSQLKSTSPESVTKLRQAAWKKFGDDHPVHHHNNK